MLSPLRHAHAGEYGGVRADGHHRAPALLRFAYVMKGADRLCLVTDSNRALDIPPDECRIGPAHGTMFISDGLVGRMPGGPLVSSIIGMEHMVRVMESDLKARCMM